jgi:opacity protein-like surface antigen
VDHRDGAPETRRRRADGAWTPCPNVTKETHSMIRILAIAMAVLLAPTALLAQTSNRGGKEARREAHPFSVNGGIGFLADVNSSPPRPNPNDARSQFLMQFDGFYNFTNNVAAGVTLLAGPSGDSSTVAMSFDGRFYLPLGSLLGNEEGILGRLVPYAGAGIGFRTYTQSAATVSNFGDPGTTDFLFDPTLGLEYDLTERLSLTTDMRFNVTSGRDNFFYSWQLLGARFRF